MRVTRKRESQGQVWRWFVQAFYAGKNECCCRKNVRGEWGCLFTYNDWYIYATQGNSNNNCMDFKSHCRLQIWLSRFRTSATQSEIVRFRTNPDEFGILTMVRWLTYIKLSWSTNDWFILRSSVSLANKSIKKLISTLSSWKFISRFNRLWHTA